MTPKEFFEMNVRGREMVAAFLFYGTDCTPCDAKLLVRGIAFFKDKATEQQYFRFVRLALVVLFERLKTPRQMNVAEYVYQEFLPAPDQKNLPMMESLFRARREAKERLAGGWKRSS
jgi:hypothetical protein